MLERADRAGWTPEALAGSAGYRTTVVAGRLRRLLHRVVELALPSCTSTVANWQRWHGPPSVARCLRRSAQDRLADRPPSAASDRWVRRHRWTPARSRRSGGGHADASRRVGALRRAADRLLWAGRHEQTVASIVKQSGDVVTQVVVGAEAADISLIRGAGRRAMVDAGRHGRACARRSKQPLGGTGRTRSSRPCRRSRRLGRAVMTPRLEACSCRKLTSGARARWPSTSSAPAAAQLLVKCTASLPGGFTYQITLPRPRPRAVTAKAEGAQWSAAGRRICMVNFVRVHRPRGTCAHVRVLLATGRRGRSGCAGSDFPRSWTPPRLLSAIDRLVEFNAVIRKRSPSIASTWPLIGGLHVGDRGPAVLRSASRNAP